MNNAVIIGASSGIGRSLAEKLAQLGWDLIICSRNERDLEALSRDLSIKFKSKVSTLRIDINSKADRTRIIDYLSVNFGSIAVFLTAGEVSDSDNGTQNEASIESIVYTNFLSIALLISGIINGGTRGNQYTFIVLSSIATGRPRGKNIVYASSKAALEFYCKGLQHRFVSNKVKIKLFRLGYVDTSMSFGKKLLFPVASPGKVARFIIKNMTGNQKILYYPFFWRPVIFILRQVPGFIYNKISY